MMNIIEHIMKLNNAYVAETRKEADVYEFCRKLDRDFDKSLDYEGKAKINGYTQELNVISTKNEYVKKIKSRPDDSFKVGDIVDCYGEKWLITEVDPNAQIVHSGEMQMCNYTINFLDKENKVSSSPCIIENYTKYNSGTKSVGSDNHMEIGTTQLYIRLPYNLKTKILDRTYKDGVLKGKNQRLLLDFDTSEPKAYEITLPDRITMKGLLFLTVTESSDLLEDDNVELMIAYYYSRFNTSSSSNKLEIKYYGNPVLYIGGEYKQFEAVFLSACGEEIEDEIAIWNVTLDNEVLKRYLDIIVEGNIIKLKASNSQLEGVPIKLELFNESGSISTYIILDVIYNA